MPPLSARARRALSVVACLGLVPILSPLAAQDSTAAHLLPPVEIHGFLEVYYRSGDPTTPDGFRLRKGDLKFNGVLSSRVRWRIGFDAGKALGLNETVQGSGDSARVTAVSVDQKSRIVQDAALTMVFSQQFGLDIGQQLIPLSLEGTVPQGKVETVERTNFIVERSRGTGLGDVRDIGVSANGLTNNGFEYHAGVFNETGDDQGSTDTNDQKAMIGRVAYHPVFFPGFEIGGSGAFEGGPTPQRRERAGGEMQYLDRRVTLRSEVMGARDGELRRLGWYALGAFRVTPPLQLVARWDDWDRDLSGETSLSNAFERQIVGGVAYLMEGGSTRVMLNAVRQTFPRISTVPASTFGLLAFEATW